MKAGTKKRPQMMGNLFRLAAIFKSKMAADKRKSKPGKLSPMQNEHGFSVMILEIRIHILILPARFMTCRQS